MSAGTPAYIAPEQLEGEPPTVRSDIYSLGLVLYELFTGKRAFEATTLEELIKLRRSDTTPTTPTSIVKDLDPLIERVIDRMQRDPQQRPSSTLQVAAALPGGDPIAAALAAGETPSPEMVAAAPKAGALRPALAVASLAGVVVCLLWHLLSSGAARAERNLPLEKPPEVLAERAREIVVVWWGTIIEAVSSLNRLTRDGTLSVKESREAFARLDYLRSRWNEVQPTEEVRDRAERLLRIHRLRAADALQLAAALVWCGNRPQRRPLIGAAGNLSEAASAEGFTVIHVL